jgi:hypothetical protein
MDELLYSRGTPALITLLVCKIGSETNQENKIAPHRKPTEHTKKSGLIGERTCENANRSILCLTYSQPHIQLSFPMRLNFALNFDKIHTAAIAVKPWPSWRSTCHYPASFNRVIAIGGRA